MVTISTSAIASSYNEAIRASKEAFIISSGAKKELNRIQKEYETLLMKVAKDLRIQNEIIAAGIAAKAFRDKRIDFKYKGNVFQVSPNFIQVTVPF